MGERDGRKSMYLIDDCETYEEIRQTIEKKPTGWFASVLPDYIYRLLFGSRPPRDSIIQGLRTEVKQEFEDITEAYEVVTAEVTISVEVSESHPETPEVEFTPDVPGEWIASQSQTVVSHPDEHIRLARKHIEWARNLDERIKSAKQADKSTFLRRAEQRRLTRIRFILDEYIAAIEEYVSVKREFEERIDGVVNEVETVESEAAPYLGYEQYLTQSVETTLRRDLRSAKQTIREFRDEINFENLTDIDTGRVPTIEGSITPIILCLDGYNPEFVKRERERYQHLFTGIGDENLSLTSTQQKAVIRDEVNNRVIAGAGTGKTLVLTTRVAYLIKSQDVAPEDILVVTFLNEAAEEMKRRLREDFGITGIEASTIHSVGYGIIDESEQRTPDVFNDVDLQNLITDIVDKEHSTIPEKFYDHFANFLLHKDLPTVQEEDFETKEAFVDRLKRQDYRTLRGEEVKSRAEKLIADFLHTHDIEYRYETRADLDFEKPDGRQTDDSEETRAYRPDFYLPDAEIYIEHYGINERGEVAEWFSQSSESYKEKIHWAREQFEHTDATLVETYQFEFSTGRLREAITHRLQHHGVTVERVPYKALVEETYELHDEDLPIQRSLKRFVGLARTFRIDPAEVPQRLTPERPRQYYFGLCGGLLLDEYENVLQETRNIDFADMIFEGISKVKNDEISANIEYEHILVDEFQDVNQAQLEFIETLAQPEETHLFVVGDDWQSIYSFQGAIVDLFINFETRFAPATTTTLDVNYRSPDQLVQASTELISQNDSQLNKNVVAASNTPAAVAKYLLGGYREYDYIDYTAALAVHLVEEYLESGCEPEEIMILCRYDNAVTYLDTIRQRLRDRSIPEGVNDEDDGVSVCSVHQAKGREANHVIITHASEGGMGFPATERDSELLDPIRDVEMNTLAEERRLFYVAITRSAQTLDVITKKGDESRFIKEIKQYVDSVTEAKHIVGLEPGEGRAVLQAKVALLFDDVHPKKHQDGVLEDGTDSVRFVSWANNDPPTLESDTWYQFKNIKINEYKGAPQVVITDLTKVEKIDHEQAQFDVATIHENLSERGYTESSVD
jgi:DNA helicase-4